MYPSKKLRLRQIERELGLSFPSVVRYCDELKKGGILATVETGNVVFYTAARTDERYLLEKRLFNLRVLHESGIIDHIRQELGNPAIALFGSFAKGEDSEESDIDLYIETP